MLLPFRKIICPVDFSEPSLVALRAANELAGHFHSRLYVVHVVPPVPLPYQPETAPAPAPELAPIFHMPSYQLELTHSSERALQDLVDQLVAPGRQVHIVVATGEAAGQIVATAEKEKADVIVIATHGQTGWRRAVFGSVAEKVVRLAPCPVLTIRASEAARGESED
jgi:nucleotide-binding universal stress UspA family protein